jgi:hypothetical protein
MPPPFFCCLIHQRERLQPQILYLNVEKMMRFAFCSGTIDVVVTVKVVVK